MKQFFGKTLTTILPLIFLSACSGGGGSGSSDGGSNSGSPNSPSNRTPVFLSSSEIAFREDGSGALLTLSASDADGDSISYSIIGGEDQSRFLIENGNQLRFGSAPDFENPADSNGDNVYRVTVEASDGNGGQSTQEIVITVVDVNDGAPEFSSAAEITVKEGVSGIFYTATAKDPDKDEVTYSLSGGADVALFSIDSTSGELRFNTAPDFESPADSDEDNNYQLFISAADSEGLAKQLSLQIAVTNLPAPSARIIFPTGGANMGGKLSSIALTARVFNLESGENASEQLVNILLDGQSPTADTASPSTWYLDTPISEGRHSYALSSQFVTGETVQESIIVKNELSISYPIGVSYDNFYGGWYFADAFLGTIFEVGSARRVISGPSVGSGPTFDPIDMEQNFPEIRSNPANDYFIVLDDNGSIYSVQRDSGDRTQLTKWVSGDLTSLTLTGSGGEAYTTRAAGTYGEIIKFDLSSGDYSVISSSNSSSPTGTGADMVYPKGVALDEANGQLYVGDDSTDSILRIDIASGDRTTISGNGIGSGEPVYQPMDLIVDFDSNQIYVANGSAQNILQVDIATGNRSVVTSWTKGKGLRLENPWSIGRGADSDRLLVSGILIDPVLMSVDTITGDRAEISSNHVGTGPSYRWHDVSYSRSTDRLLVVSQSNHAAAEIDLQNGNRTIVSYFDPNDSPRVVASTIVSGESGRNAYIFDEYSDRLLKIDLESGEPEVVSASDIGEGPEFYGLVEAMELDATNNRMLLLQASGLMSVDLDSGDREIISDNYTGSSPFFDSVEGLALDLVNNRAFVSDSRVGDIGGIWQVDLATGDRKIIAAPVHGGTTDQIPTDVVLDSTGNRLLVGTESGSLVAIDLDGFSQSTLSSGKGCDSDCRGGGVAVASLDSLTIDADGRRIFAYDNGMFGVRGVVVIDLRSGQRALASK
ncbi:Ig-like domain-containing protein [Microbulbifer sp. CnH-101-E]|uniref:Ig-like domain-containing protein n=1 Tax=unclassified Microbulbifer TaxID=2619833 RepID=UPI004039C24D